MGSQKSVMFSNMYIYTELYNKVIPLSRILLEKLTVAQLVKKLQTFYKARTLNGVFKRDRH